VAVQCTCGQLKIVQLGHLLNGRTVSCGCWRAEQTGERAARHRETGTYLHRTWRAIKRRCYYLREAAYPYYGGRGITMCAEWRDSYEAFRDYMLFHCGERPAGYSIDRIDNDGHYEPGNVRWADRKTQRHNRRPSQRQRRQPLASAA
jgi:hypothetical protein